MRALVAAPLFILWCLLREPEIDRAVETDGCSEHHGADGGWGRG